MLLAEAKRLKSRSKSPLQPAEHLWKPSVLPAEEMKFFFSLLAVGFHILRETWLFINIIPLFIDLWVGRGGGD